MWDLLAAGQLCSAEILSPFLPCGGLLGKGILSSTPTLEGEGMQLETMRFGSDVHSPDLEIKRRVGKHSAMLTIKNIKPSPVLRKANLCTVGEELVGGRALSSTSMN